MCAGSIWARNSSFKSPSFKSPSFKSPSLISPSVGSPAAQNLCITALRNRIPLLLKTCYKQKQARIGPVSAGKPIYGVVATTGVPPDPSSGDDAAADASHQAAAALQS